MKEAKKKSKAKAALDSLMTAVFPVYNPEDNDSAAITFESGNGLHSTFLHPGYGDNEGNEDGTTVVDGKPKDRVYLNRLPPDRFLRYRFYKEMEDDSTVHTAIELHLAHALSVDNKTGDILFLKPKDESQAEYVSTLQKEVVSKINERINSWSWPMCIYGVNYVRPHAVQGLGIQFFESDYYTLANNIREYEKGGMLAGFTSEHLLVNKSGEQVRLAEPWTLIALKIPTWRPDMDVEPVNYSGKSHSLYSDVKERYPMETQNYGTSMLHAAWESWTFLRNSIRSLAKSRQIASVIDRMVSVNTDNLDHARAAEYLRLVATQLQEDREAVANQAKLEGYLPVIINSLIPVMGGKGSVSIDTFTTDPNIAHIEDIMFHVKRLCGSLGIEPSMLGFSDMLSGGLGEGGFFRTAIQAAMRANQIRIAVREFTHRAIDIHTAYRDGHVWPDGEEPYEICFNSLNTAIELEEAEADERKANFMITVTTLLDMLEQSSISESKTLKSELYNQVFEHFDGEKVEQILKELSDSKSESEQGDALMESLGIRIEGQTGEVASVKAQVHEALNEFFSLKAGEVGDE